MKAIVSGLATTQSMTWVQKSLPVQSKAVRQTQVGESPQTSVSDGELEPATARR